MENKDWRKEFDEKFFTKETFDWKNPTPSEIKEFIAESLLKSKQEEIEEACCINCKEMLSLKNVYK